MLKTLEAKDLGRARGRERYRAADAGGTAAGALRLALEQLQTLPGAAAAEPECRRTVGVAGIPLG